MIWFWCNNRGEEGFSGFVFLLCSAFAYTALYLLLPVLFSFAAVFCRGKKALLILIIVIASVFAFLTQVILISDVMLLKMFGYHINGLVINLLLTPGGFESMGLDNATIVPLSLALLVFLCAHIAFGIYTRCSVSFGKFSNYVVKNRSVYWISSVCVVIFISVSILMTGFADYFQNVNVLSNLEVYPFTLTMRMRSVLRRLGVAEPKRQASIIKGARDGKIIYPAMPISRKADRKKYNIIWLVGESLRADLLSEEIMPQTWNFAKSGNMFTNHYSGGHGTRPGMFSMFYGLYGLNWTSFLNNKRGPLVIDWMIEDGYQFLCQTSARFTYPEFDRTIFASLPQDALMEHSKGIPWERDIKLTDTLLDFIEKRDKSRSFFAFGFFESTHASYSFPPEGVIRTKYLDKINYATVSAKDAELLYNRDANAAHHIDRQFGRIIDMVRNDPELMENTIIVITGDHGEEFFEKGRLGHNSTFVEEQIRVPLVIYHPDNTPKVYDCMTHHTDIVPTIAVMLGVTNPPSDFSVGENLFSKDFKRDYFLVCGWEIAAYVNKTHKCILPIGKKGGYFKREVTTRDDGPCEDDGDEFFRLFSKDLIQIQNDLSRFVK